MKISIFLAFSIAINLLTREGLAQRIEISQGERVVIVGSGMASRMAKFGHFETEMYLNFPDKNIQIRNMADEGNTPGFRPHPGRHYEYHFAFPGAKELVHESYRIDTKSEGHFESPDQWLTRLRADTIIAFFGYNSSFEGEDGLERYEKEFEGFVKHTLTQRYNGYGPPKLVVVSPTDRKSVV